jgi:hypothetical protein
VAKNEQERCMTPPTGTEIRVRIEAICATIPGIDTVLTREEADITADLLPAIQVWSRDDTGTPQNRDMAVYTLNYDIILYVVRLAQEQQALWLQVPALNTAEAWKLVIPEFFRKQARRLELNSVPLTGIQENTSVLISSDGPELRQWNQAAFSAITHHLSVRILRT